MDGHERVQAGAPSAANHYLLVIEGFRVAVVPRRGGRARGAHCVDAGDPVVAVPVGDPEPVVAPAEDPVLGGAPGDAGGVLVPGVVLVPGCVPDVASPGVVLVPDWVLGVPELDVPAVEFHAVEPVGAAVPSVPFAGSPRPAPPGLLPAANPPVARGARLRTVVVTVAGLVGAAVELEI